MPESLNKVPAVTLAFWIIKIAATTLGETGGDTVTMTLNWGYLDGTALFLVALVLLVIAQIIAKKFHPFLYWATIIASTTFGTTMADFADRSLGIGYTGGSLLLLFCLLATLGLWYASLGSISVNTVSTPKVEMFYWAAITFSQTLGTALGDWMADSTGLGYEGGAVVFGVALAVVAGANVREARAVLPPGNAVQQWDKIAEDTVVGSGAFQNEGLIYMAYVSNAMYSSISPGERGGPSTTSHITSTRNTRFMFIRASISEQAKKDR